MKKSNSSQQQTAANPFSAILERMEPHLEGGANACEVDRAYAEFLRSAARILLPLGETATDLRSRAEVDIASQALTLISHEIGLSKGEGFMNTDRLDRPAILYGLCETIVASLALARTLDLKIELALERAAEHIYIEGRSNRTAVSPLRSGFLQMPFGKMSFEDLVDPLLPEPWE